MTDEQILKMVSEIVEETDYDIWKELFYYPTRDGDTEDVEPSYNRYVNIVRRHLGDYECQ